MTYVKQIYTAFIRVCGLKLWSLGDCNCATRALIALYYCLLCTLDYFTLVCMGYKLSSDIHQMPSPITLTHPVIVLR